MHGTNQSPALHPMFEAGDKSQIRWGAEDWVFLDIGFSKDRPTCGIILGIEDPLTDKFGEARKRVLARIRDSKTTVNLVIEAPLSVCFDSEGNPKPRSIEKQGNKSRYWYVGAGCVVMVAAIYLIRDIVQAGPDLSVRLFEGFVSYKDHSVRSSHHEDVSLLREVVRDPVKFSGSIYAADQLRSDPSDFLYSAFRVAGVDCGIPAVIKRSL